MAKERRKNLDSEVSKKAFNEAEKQYIITNFKGLSVTRLARELSCKEEDVKSFILELIRTPGAGRSKSTFVKKPGVTASTEIASQRGDEHAKRKASNFSQFSDAIHKPLG